MPGYTDHMSKMDFSRDLIASLDEKRLATFCARCVERIVPLFAMHIDGGTELTTRVSELISSLLSHKPHIHAHKSIQTTVPMGIVRTVKSLSLTEHRILQKNLLHCVYYAGASISVYDLYAYHWWMQARSNHDMGSGPDRSVANKHAVRCAEFSWDSANMHDSTDLSPEITRDLENLASNNDIGQLWHRGIPELWTRAD